MANYRLKIGGMHCLDCAHKVEAALRGVPGVETARVKYLQRTAEVTADDTRVTPEVLRHAVQTAGYTVEQA
ncbi:MAG: heavy-metal-associated domain-containing protein [Firmicutes bacterium]|nr:heavy-metal-associated domain-containing protein [Bacillota bacterium]